MSLTIPVDVQQRMNVLLRTGLYASEEDILRAAVTALEAHNADMAAIQNGINEMKNGRYRSFGDFDAEFRKRNQVESGA
ncbi:MAG: type II toxin-antitoxin system ParD family antitoxin [Planctomycetes bacterium]|nr:type II toxin-antitoxin system ParD family antitoxin [Planctomycetota bacterium]